MNKQNLRNQYRLSQVSVHVGDGLCVLHAPRRSCLRRQLLHHNNVAKTVSNWL